MLSFKILLIVLNHALIDANSAAAVENTNRLTLNAMKAIYNLKTGYNAKNKQLKQLKKLFKNRSFNVQTSKFI